MKWSLVVAVLLVALMGVRAEGPDDQYVAIYNFIQEADSLNKGGQFSRALTKYREAQTALLKFQKDYRDWNAKVVNYRLNYLAAAVEAVSAKVPAPAAPTPAPATPGPAGTPSAVPAPPGKPTPSADWEGQLNTVRDQVRRLQEEKASLEAKLKEALAAQPAAVDPRELAKADAKIKTLLKEKDLLQASLDQEKAKLAHPAGTQSLEKAEKALARANRDLAEETRKANALEKEKNALQVKLNNLTPSSRNAGTIASTQKELEIANRKLAERTKLTSQLTQEKEAMQSRLKALKADSEAASALRAENEILKKRLAERKTAPPAAAQKETARRQTGRTQAQVALLESDKEMLRLEKLALENQLKRLSAQAATPKATPAPAKAEDTNRIKKLQQERDDLKQQLDASVRELKSARAAPPAAPPPPAKPEAASRIKKLEQERDDMKRQLDALAQELKSARAMAAAATPSPAKAEDTSRVKKLQQECDDLRKQLAAATKKLDSRKGKAETARVLEMERQLASLHARLDVLQANPVPYTPEEAALFRQPEAKPIQTASKSAAKASKALPPDTVALAAEANRYFAAKQLDKAEDRYLQVLREDQNHVPTLANLAAVELELNHLPTAETNILQALALAPDDPACLMVLGRLRFRQAQYDAALDALSRAAKADQKNAEVQNYLGLTLSAKGLRLPAETALRKAIQLEPGYGEAHNNLAVIYATQKPPLIELARWHYQRALAAGSPANPDLEKLIESRKAADDAK